MVTKIEVLLREKSARITTELSNIDLKYRMYENINKQLSYYYHREYMRSERNPLATTLFLGRK